MITSAADVALFLILIICKHIMYNAESSSALVVKKSKSEQVYTAQLKEQLDLKKKKHKLSLMQNGAKQYQQC
jgi:hypothetical protein